MAQEILTDTQRKKLDNMSSHEYLRYLLFEEGYKVANSAPGEMVDIYEKLKSEEV